MLTTLVIFIVAVPALLVTAPGKSSNPARVALESLDGGRAPLAPSELRKKRRI